MADNVSITAGTGTTIAADDIGAGVLVQRVKTTWGPDGTANDADVATGKPLPVQLRSATGTAADLSVLAAVTATANALDINIKSGTSTLAAETTKVIGTVNISVAQPITPVDQYGQYEIVAASQTAQALGATGATGDYLAYVTVFPGVAACGLVTILDNATGWGTFPGGGTTALPSLVPFRIDVGAFSTSGAWKITTGANVTCTGVGKFT